MSDDYTNMTEQEKIEDLAQKIKVLFGFCAFLIPYKDLIKAAFVDAADRESRAVGAAVVLEAFGQDYEEVEAEARLHKERAEAIYNLVDVLDRTEKDRAEFTEKQKAKRAGAMEVRRMLGL